jgi:hypothetical protein
MTGGEERSEMKEGKSKEKNKEGNVSVAGRTVYIRHATESDLDTIRNERIAGGVEMPEIDPAHIVVAVEEDRVIGFGIIGKATAEGAVCVTVFEKEDRRGIGTSIVRHAVENSEQTTIPHAGDGQPAFSSPRVVISKKQSRRTSTQGWTSSVCTVSARRLGAARRKRNTWIPAAGRNKSGQ